METSGALGHTGCDDLINPAATPIETVSTGGAIRFGSALGVLPARIS